MRCTVRAEGGAGLAGSSWLRTISAGITVEGSADSVSSRMQRGRDVSGSERG